MDTVCEVNEQSQKEIMDFIIDCVDVPQTLRKLSENLYHSYLNRKESFPTNSVSNQRLKSKFIIPLSKMNHEERIFYSLLTETNLKIELPYILEYLTNLYEGIVQIHRIKPSESLENSLSLFVAQNGLVTYFYTRLKSFHEKEFEDDDDEFYKNFPKKEKTQEEIDKEIEELQSHPLFMTELPKDIENNKHLQAIQALQYEGKPEDVAFDLIEKSKEKLKVFLTSKNRKYLKEAMISICNAVDHVEGDDKIPNEAKFKVYSHRAEIQLLVKNWGYAITDLNSANSYLENEETVLKIIDCYIRLENYNKATEIVNQKIKLFKDSIQLKNKAALIESLVKEDQEKANKFDLFKDLSKSEKLNLYKILKAKGIKMKPQIHNIPSNYASKIYLDENNLLHFPILIIYEEFSFTDYIQDFPEDGLIQDIFDILFQEKLPWDKENKYHINSIISYYEISEQDKKDYCRYYPLRNDDKLMNILTNKNVYLNGLPVIVIVSQLSMFYKHFLNKKIILKR